MRHPRAFAKRCQAALAAIVAGLSAPALAALAPTETPAGVVVIAANNWASQVVGAHVLKALLGRVGQRAVLKQVAVDLQVAALGEGELHVQTEVRESVMGESIDTAVRARRVLRAGRHDARSREGWWYPDYVAALCPGLPRWQALRGCADLFERHFVAGPLAWKHHEEERVQALNLPFKVVHADSVDALLDQLSRAWASRRPILLFRWSPHWTDLRYPGHFVEFPPFDPNCVTDPSWGPNPDAIYDCDLYRQGDITKAVWNKFPERYPCAYEVVRRMAFSSRDLATMEEWVAVQKVSAEEAAERWLRANVDRWRQWVPKCRAKT